MQLLRLGGNFILRTRNSGFLHTLLKNTSVIGHYTPFTFLSVISISPSKHFKWFQEISEEETNVAYRYQVLLWL